MRRAAAFVGLVALSIAGAAFAQPPETYTLKVTLENPAGGEILTTTAKCTWDAWCNAEIPRQFFNGVPYAVIFETRGQGDKLQYSWAFGKIEQGRTRQNLWEYKTMRPKLSGTLDLCDDEGGRCWPGSPKRPATPLLVRLRWETTY